MVSPTRKSRLAIAGGVLTLIAACILIVFGVYFYGLMGILMFHANLPKYGWLVSGVIWVIAFTFGLTSGVMATRRKHFVLSIIGAGFPIIGALVGMSGAFVGIDWTRRTIILHGWNLYWVGIYFGLPIILLSILSVIFLTLAKQAFS